MSEAMRLNESQNSYLHKNANSTTVALSGENGWVSSMASLGGEKRKWPPMSFGRRKQGAVPAEPGYEP